MNMHAIIPTPEIAPAQPRAALSLPIPRGIPDKTRKAVEDALERLAVAQQALLDYLDAQDGDADAEPSLGSLAPKEWRDQRDDWKQPKASRMDGELEPSLGSHSNQMNWSGGGSTDAEGDEHDGCEPDVDDEPALGWSADMNQSRALEDVQSCCGFHGEPNLGSNDARIDQTGWSAGGDRDDLEMEHDGREPSLGAGIPDFVVTISIGSRRCWRGLDQSHWAEGNRDDREIDAGDEGELDDALEPGEGDLDHVGFGAI